MPRAHLRQHFCKMGQAQSVNKEAIVALAKKSVPYALPLGPVNPVRDGDAVIL